MLRTIFSPPEVAVMEKALSGAALRHKTISNNIANVNTPGFKKNEVSFEDHLAAAMDGRRLPLAMTNGKHLPGTSGEAGVADVHQIADTSLRLDGNNVDVDVEMANLAKNNIYYNSVAQQLSRYFANLKSAINEGRR